MKKKLTPLGTSDFKEVIEKECYFVDKTLLIKEILEGYSVLLFCRPRRFGKTLNMNMLRYFFAKGEDNAHLFEGLAISRDEDSMKHQGQYPVIFFSLRHIKNENWADARTHIQTTLLEVFTAFEPAFAGTPMEAKFQHEKGYLTDPGTTSYNIAYTLKNLGNLLAELHKTKVVILVDEYDSPIQSSWLNGFYQEAIDFFRIMLGAALKDNNNLLKGVLTGILRVSKESMFSEVNNFWASTVLDRDVYAPYFGFSEEEVKEMLAHYDMNGDHLEEIREWYDGYHIYNRQIYNPWSVLNYVNSPAHAPEPYWVNTSQDSLLRRLFFNRESGISAYLKALIDGQKIPLQLEKHLVFTEIETSRSAVWTMLVLAGYLTAENQRDTDTWDISIPNKEIRYNFLTTITKWLKTDVRAAAYDPMLEMLLGGEEREFERHLKRFAGQVFSFHDTKAPEPESFYHAFLLGLVARLENEYLIRSNRESGFGRFDIALFPKDKRKRGVLIELKSPDTEYGETMEDAIAAAGKQMNTKKYETEFEASGIERVFKIAVAAMGKEVKVKEIK